MLKAFPLTRRRPTAARGFTLAELVVALSIGSVAFGAFALVVAQEERAHAEIARRVRARSQLREGIAPLAADLRAASPGMGDITAGGARDSSIELRTTIGTAVMCEVRGQSIHAALASFVSRPGAGDTAWAYVTSDTRAEWTPLPVGGVSTLAPDRPPLCDFPALAASVVGGRRSGVDWYTLALVEPPPVALVPGVPLRVTRPVRYSLYRAPDARWYLGRREWSPAQASFETIQPVSGPHRPYAAGGGTSGIELAYFDREGAEVPSGSGETHRIATVTITLRAPPPRFDPVVRERRDVTSVSVAFRNDR